MKHSIVRCSFNWQRRAASSGIFTLWSVSLNAASAGRRYSIRHQRESSSRYIQRGDHTVALFSCIPNRTLFTWSPQSIRPPESAMSLLHTGPISSILSRAFGREGESDDR